MRSWGRRVLLTSLTLSLVSSPFLARGAGAASIRRAPAGRASPGSATLGGFLSASGGTFLRDSSGRIVILHGVNVVYKHPPFVVYPDLSKPWNFTRADAEKIAALGFDVVRLGILWQGLEPGKLAPNSPSVCNPGRHVDPGQMDKAVLNRYLDHVAETVALLASVHVYTIIDMHQDVYNQVFGGEGAPTWAVCTGGTRAYPTPADWRRAYRERAAYNAYKTFFDNSARGDLQAQYQAVWQAVASRFAHDPWVAGYDLFNEPAIGDKALPCFYAGRGAGPLVTESGSPVACPPTEPRTGLVPRILQAAPRQLVFLEPDVAAHPLSGQVGPLDYPNLVLAFHLYCPFRNLDGNPSRSELAACAAHYQRVLATRRTERARAASDNQPGGPAWFLGEFGATSSVADIAQVTTDANRLLLGWCYWSWEYYGDPTGSASEALATPRGVLLPDKAWALAQTYAQAVAGTPLSMSFDPASGRFTLEYVPGPTHGAPTVVFVPTRIHYPRGYCPKVSGATVTSRPGAAYLTLANIPGASMVRLVVSAGSCSDPYA